MSELNQFLERKHEKISPDHAFRILNTYINYPCLKYARRIQKVMPQIRAYVYAYEEMLRSQELSEGQKGIVITFISGYYLALKLLRDTEADIQTRREGLVLTC